MTWNELIQNRIKSLTSTEFILTAGLLLIVYSLALKELVTTQVAALIAPIITYIWGRTSQKKNGNGK